MWRYPALQRRFKEILVEHGQDVYLRRRCTSCSQTGPYAKYDDLCEVCGGTGYAQTLEKFTMRKMIVGTQYSFFKAMGIFASGVILDEGCYFFCEGNVNPKYGDLIYDFDYATNTWIPYEINKVLERRYDKRVLFYNCAVRLREGTDT
jgi:hypothetical protein